MIKYAILGILSCRPMTGYDVKKIIQDSAYMYWSGNNNQIYKALVELLKDGLVTGESVFQEGAPSKKVYTITDKGLDELRRRAASKPESAEFKNAFLVQLAWADVLNGEALSALLENYENEIRLQLVLNREKIRRGGSLASRTGREAFLWEAIDGNVLSFYENELRWIRGVRRRLEEYGGEAASST